MSSITPVPSIEIAAPYRAIGVAADADVWVFGYGSLMWNPGFPYVERRRATVRGWHRGFSVYSFRHRGTRACPGAVLGLDRGGTCRGIAYRVAAAEAPGVLDYLWEREMQNAVYEPRLLTAALEHGPRVPTVAFTVVRGHEQYCGRLPPDDLAGLIRQGVGESGRNVDYLVNTVRHLEELGIRDRNLEGLVERVVGDTTP
ncbi:gamma-glutamylcyclotransferase [Nitrospirillum iridis]|uniref:glutathione-specific gamma-glutamylcyclotransferase n=1 Tax=Nitrospirillum iridis TaxID=765888 RepID=A0A7X0AT26_9PROT|nr:gamma-glutamylcyclotransferase [Nitrospirillum iridis]MBB6249560.1 cation transport protein ChaC [Nitrospirillum iridis]